MWGTISALDSDLIGSPNLDPAVAVWTGAEAIVIGPNDALIDTLVGAAVAYDPATDSWRELARPPAATAGDEIAVWTGTEMLLFGGSEVVALAYDPATDAWRDLASGYGVMPMGYMVGGERGTPFVWTGSELLVWSVVGRFCGQQHGSPRLRPCQRHLACPCLPARWLLSSERSGVGVDWGGMVDLGRYRNRRNRREYRVRRWPGVQPRHRLLAGAFGVAVASTACRRNLDRHRDADHRRFVRWYRRQRRDGPRRRSGIQPCHRYVASSDAGYRASRAATRVDW